MSRLHFVIIGLCASLSMVALRLSAADSADAKPKYVKIVNVASGKILAVEDDSPDSGSHAVLAKDVDSSNKHSRDRQWKLEKDGNYFKIANRASGEVLDVEGESTEEDHQMIVWDDKADSDGNDNQRWAWEPKGSSLPLVDAKSANDDASKAQARRIKSKSSGLVLDVDSDGNVVQRSVKPDSKSQLWIVVGVDN
jgi:hypothetical protein